MAHKGLTVEGILVKICDLNNIDSDVDDIDYIGSDSDDKYELHDVSSDWVSYDDVIKPDM